MYKGATAATATFGKIKTESKRVQPKAMSLLQRRNYASAAAV